MRSRFDQGFLQGINMADLLTKCTVRAGEIFLISLFAFLQWPNMAYAFNSPPPGEFYHKTLTHRALEDVAVALQSADPIKTIGFSETAVQEIQKSVQAFARKTAEATQAENGLEDKESPCDNEHLMGCRVRILQFRKSIVAALTQQPLPDNVGPMVWNVFGEALYRIQNFYSHSDWIYEAVAPTCRPETGGTGAQDFTRYPASEIQLRESICAEILNAILIAPERCVSGCDEPGCDDVPDSNCRRSNDDLADGLGGHAEERPLTAAALSINAAVKFVNQIVSEVKDRREMNRNRQDWALCVFLDDHACAFSLPILPGLAGGGSKTTAGSGPNRTGGKIIRVTNLNASGPGSLRHALEASGPRIVVFDVSGYIHLTSMINIHEPFVTIAGQTAPFPGITLRGGGIRIKTHDVLVQHIRIRPGDDPVGPSPISRDSLSIADKYESLFNIVVDHVSLSWSVDENMDVWYPGHRDITIVNSILSEALDNSIHPKGTHSKGLLVGFGTRNLLVLGNLFAHNDQRNMRVKGDTSTLFVNNVVYNWHGAAPAGAATAYGGKDGPFDASIVGNVYIRGLNTRKGEGSYPVHFDDNVLAGTRVYVADNQSIRTSDDSWSVVKTDAKTPIRVDSWPNDILSLKVKKGNRVRGWVLGTAGARRADADPVDSRVLNDVMSGMGRIIDSQDDVGGWPPLESRVRGVGGVPELIVPSQEIQESGYTKLEEWLHLLAKWVEVPNWIS